MIHPLPNPFLEFQSVARPADRQTAGAAKPWGAAPVVTRRHNDHGDRQEVEAVVAIGQADAPVSTSDEFFPYRFGRKQQSRQEWIDAKCLRAIENAIDPLPLFLRRTPAPQSKWLDWLHELHEVASC